MNFRLNSFFWTFAGILAAEHVIAIFTGANNETSMLTSALVIALTVWLLVVPTDLLRREPRPRAVKPPHEHFWRHWYDTDGYYINQPHVIVRSRVHYCLICREVRRTTDPIPHYQGGQR